MTSPQVVNIGAVPATYIETINNTQTPVPPGPTERDPAQPTYTSDAYERLRWQWRTMRDIYGGTRVLHAFRQLYIRKYEAERMQDFNVRATSANLFNAFRRTIVAMVGLVTSRDPEFGDDTPVEIRGTPTGAGAKSGATERPTTGSEADWENIDGKGTHGDVFIREMLLDGLQTGLNGVMVDAPTIEAPGALSLRDEEELGVRPYWSLFRAEDILNGTQFTPRGGKAVFTMLILRDYATNTRGEFGSETVPRYTVYRRRAALAPNGDLTSVVYWQRWTEQREPTTGKVALVSAGSGTIANVTEIPFAPVFYGEKVGPLEAMPPLGELGEENLTHFRLRTDLMYLLAKTDAPTLVLLGRPTADREKNIVIGPNETIDIPSDGDAKWLELAGTGLTPTANEMKKCEDRMATLGMAFLSGDKREAETAEAHRIDTTAQNALLASAVRSVKDALERALMYHAQMRKLPTGGSIKVNKEFEQILIDTASIAEYRALESGGQISLDTLWDVLEQGGRLPDGFDREKERGRIVKDMEARAAMMPEPADGDPDKKKKEEDKPPEE